MFIKIKYNKIYHKYIKVIIKYVEKFTGILAIKFQKDDAIQSRGNAQLTNFDIRFMYFYGLFTLQRGQDKTVFSCRCRRCKQAIII